VAAAWGAFVPGPRDEGLEPDVEPRSSGEHA